jgi:hypothetical protein
VPTSVEPDQVSATWVQSITNAFRSVGVEGAITSGVVALTTADGIDIVPFRPSARTR